MANSVNVFPSKETQAVFEKKGRNEAELKLDN